MNKVFENKIQAKIIYIHVIFNNISNFLPRWWHSKVRKIIICFTTASTRHICFILYSHGPLKTLSRLENAQTRSTRGEIITRLPLRRTVRTWSLFVYYCFNEKLFISLIVVNLITSFQLRSQISKINCIKCHQSTQTYSFPGHQSRQNVINFHSYVAIYLFYDG